MFAARGHTGQPGRLLLTAFLVAWLGMVLVAGCRGQAEASDGIQFKYEISPQPPAEGPTEITVRLLDANNAPLRGAKVEIEGNMAHAGMVPVRVSARETPDGRYISEGYRFTMGGDWFITVQATLADGRKAEKVFDLPGVAGAKGASQHGPQGGAGR